LDAMAAKRVGRGFTGSRQVPYAVDLALQSHAQIPKIDGVPLRVFWYSSRHSAPASTS
jgi:hypothetical protein